MKHTPPVATYTYTVHIEPAEEGGFVAHVPALNGISTQGETYEEVVAMAEDLIIGYLEVLTKRGQPIPSHDLPPSSPIALRMQVALPALS